MDYENVQCYNVKIKDFGSETQIQTYAQPIMKGKENPNKGKKKDEIKKDDLSPEEREQADKKNAERSKRRAVQEIYNITRANHWEWFVTITFRGSIEQRCNFEWCASKLQRWIHNTKQNSSPDLKYIFVPELHMTNESAVSKDGKHAFHFHGLLADVGSLSLADSGHKDKNGRTIYNLKSYKSGFTTCTEVTQSEAVSKYILKYVTKELAELTKGKKRYWASKNCHRPDVQEMFLDGTAELTSFMQDIECGSDLLHMKTVEYQVSDWKPRQAITYYELDNMKEE